MSNSTRTAPPASRNFRPVGAALACLGAWPAAAQTIDDTIATPVETATIADGAPSDITITEDGAIDIETGSDILAVTINSDNGLTNEGDITLLNVHGGVGVLIEGGHTGFLYSDGVIDIIEDYEREDEDDDDDVDGPYAIGESRTGVLLTDDGAFTGDIVFGTSSDLTVEGNDSAGIRLLSALNGNFVNDGTISVLGDNAIGVDVREGVTGDFLQSGVLHAVGVDATGISILGDVGGAFVNEGTLYATGFASRSASNYADPDDLDEDDTPIDERIDAEDLQPGGPAVAIGGSVANGILNNGIIDDFIDEEEEEDETKDTIEDFDENRSTGSIYSYGSGEALLISPDLDPDSTGDLVVGTVVETVRDTLDDDDDDDTTETLAVFDYTYGLINRGAIYGNGLNVGYEATGVRIEGAADGSQATIIEGGIQNLGSIKAVAYEANATALSIGDYAEIGRIVNDGSIYSSIATETDHVSTAILIEDNASISSIVNTGTIIASVDGNGGSAYAIYDTSGELTLIDNQGVIRAGFASNDEAVDTPGVARAIDLSAYGADQGVTIIQTAQTPVDDVNGDDEIDEDDIVQPAITGAIYLGAGDDVLDIQEGSINGAVSTGAGDDTFLLSATNLRGDVEFGAGADIFTITNDALFIGELHDSSNDLVLTISDSEVELENVSPVTIGSLTITGASELSLSADARDPDISEARLNVQGSALIEGGATINASIENFVNDDLTIGLVEAADLTVDGDTDVEIVAPAIYNQQIVTTPTGLSISLTPKSADDLGLNLNESAAYASVLEVAEASDAFGSSLSDFIEEEDLVSAYKQLLPDYSDAMTRFLSNETSIATGVLASRLTQAHDSAPGFWLQHNLSYLRESATSETTGYDGIGITFQAGVDREVAPDLLLGGGAAFRIGKFSLAGDSNTEVETTAYDLTGYAAYTIGAWRFDIAGVVGRANFYSERSTSLAGVLNIYEGEWNGVYYGGGARASYMFRRGSFYARPELAIDLFTLSQDEYSETADITDPVLALDVSSADTDRTAGVAKLTLGRAVSREGNAYAVRDLYNRSSGPVTFQEAYVGYRSEIDSTGYAADVRFQSLEDSFTVFDPTAYDDAVVVGVGLGSIGDGYALTVNYDGEFAGDFMSHKLGAAFRLFF